MHIFRHLFVCFQTSVYKLGEFHKNRNNSTVFEELSVSIVDLTQHDGYHPRVTMGKVQMTLQHLV